MILATFLEIFFYFKIAKSPFWSHPQLSWILSLWYTCMFLCLLHMSVFSFNWRLEQKDNAFENESSEVKFSISTKLHLCLITDVIVSISSYLLSVTKPNLVITIKTNTMQPVNHRGLWQSQSRRDGELGLSYGVKLEESLLSKHTLDDNSPVTTHFSQKQLQATTRSLLHPSQSGPSAPHLYKPPAVTFSFQSDSRVTFPCHWFTPVLSHCQLTTWPFHTSSVLFIWRTPDLKPPLMWPLEMAGVSGSCYVKQHKSALELALDEMWSTFSIC